MTRKNPPAKWPLPDVVNPSTSLCVTIQVPNDRTHKAAFWGALLDLASAYKWQDDPSHTAKQVALVWRNVIDNLKLDQCSIEPTVPHGTELEFDMGIRVDCDCRVWITCCDGTEKELATVGMIGQPGQPGTGQPQPQPNGGQACYTFTMPANQSVLLPTALSTGDVVNIQNAAGAGSNSHDSLWHLLNGNQFFLGADVGYPETNAANPVPAAPTTSLIITIAGTSYAVGTGSFTVPGGITNQAATFQVNDNNLSGLSGNFTFGACVTNNSVGTFTHHFDFRVSPAGWLIGSRPTGNPTGNCSWIPGTGYAAYSDPAQGTNVGVIELWKEGVNLNGCSVRMIGSTPGSLSNNGIYTAPNGSYKDETMCTQFLTSDPQTAIDITASGFTGGVQDLMLLIFAPSNYQWVYVTDCYISGPGVDPF